MDCIKTHDVWLRAPHGERKLILRPVSDADIPLLCELNSDPRALEWADDNDPEPYTEEMVRQIWGHVSQNALCFIVELDGLPIGDCWLQKMNLPKVITRYPEGTDIRRIDMSIGRVDYWNRGIGSAMIKMLTEYAFTRESTQVLHCVCSSKNIRSNRVWQKNGYRLAWTDPDGECHWVLCRPDESGVSIRKTTHEEAALLTEIQKEAFGPLYERYHDSGNPALRGVEDILNRLDSPFFRCYTIFCDKEMVGGIIYKCQGRTPFQSELKPGEYYLQRVFIRPEHQGKHIARTAIALCEKEFPDATAYFVDFPEDLEKNRRCYQSVGFQDTGKRLEFAPGLLLAAMEKQV